jgi:hypothetical protein
MAVSAQLARFHDSYSEELPALLERKGWVELSCDPEPTQLEMTLNGALSILPDEEWPKGTLSPSIAQFYFDLCGLWDYTSYENYADITVSLIGSGMDFLDSEGHNQEYTKFSLENPEDWEFFITSLLAETALIFPGRFRAMRVGKDEFKINTKRKNQMTLSAVCVDVDSSSREVGGAARIPVSAESLEALISRIGEGLLPSYISLTGNGAHLWYLFPQMPTGGPKAVTQRRRMSDLYRAITEYISMLTDGLPLVVDPGWINHGYRAPGSITKYGDPCRCFARPGDPFSSRIMDPVRVYNSILSVTWFDGDSYSEITEEDVVFRSPEELTAWRAEKEAEPRKERPSTDKQRRYASDLFEKGLMDEDHLAAVMEGSSKAAIEIIAEAAGSAPSPGAGSSRRGANPLPESVTIDGKPRRVRAHHFKTGKDGGGVYKTILDTITRVEPGRRERCLYMLAGVAYLMCDPVMPPRKVKRDFVALLDTEWARRGSSPLTMHDVESAMSGYCRENAARIYKKSIISMLGFNPFSSGCYDDESNPPAKRNGRKQADHLCLARECYKNKSRDSKVAALSVYLRENPGASMRRASRETGISRPTVAKYWDEASAAASTPLPPL